MGNSAASERRYPQRGDRLFKKAPDVVRTPQTDFDEIIGRTHELVFVDSSRRAFFRTAKLVADQIVADQSLPVRAEPGLWFPMVFNFRHYVELSLKAMMIKSGTMADLSDNAKAKERVWTTKRMSEDHGLEALWRDVMATLRELLLPKDFREADDAVQRLIIELHNRDPKSQFFRYPTDKDGKAHPREKLPHIAMDEWTRITSQVHQYFEDWLDYLDAQIAALEDWQANLPGPTG